MGIPLLISSKKKRMAYPLKPEWHDIDYHSLGPSTIVSYTSFRHNLCIYINSKGWVFSIIISKGINMGINIPNTMEI